MASSLPFGGPLPSTSTNGINSRQLQAPSKPAPVVDLPALQNASRVLQDQFIKDAQVIPDLADTLTTRKCVYGSQSM
jgi:nuclear pore complex protein Nup155